MVGETSHFMINPVVSEIACSISSEWLAFEDSHKRKQVRHLASDIDLYRARMALRRLLPRSTCWYSSKYNTQETSPHHHLTGFDYDLLMPGVGRPTKPLLVVIVLLFILVFVLERLGLLR